MNFEEMVANWKTTLMGAVNAVITWTIGIGQSLPTTKMEWLAAAAAVVQVLFGLAAKDAGK